MSSPPPPYTTSSSSPVTKPPPTHRPSHPGQRIPSKPKGHFQNGIWHCNCQLPASHFEVRKQGPNKGKWFYTCQSSARDDRGCGFFLWDADAQGREKVVVMAAARSEPIRAGGIGDAVNRDGDAGGLMSVQGHIRASNKWLDDLGHLPPREDGEGGRADGLSGWYDDHGEDGEFGDWGLSVEEEQALSQSTTGFVPRSQHLPLPETPRKKLDTSITADSASRKRNRDDEHAWPTPATGHADENPFSRTKVPRTNDHDISRTAHAHLITPDITPTPPTRFRDALSPSTSSPFTPSTDITTPILSLLSPHNLPPETTSAVRSALEAFSARTTGIAKGRDVSRAVIKEKERVIAGLQVRISALERERAMDGRVIRNFRGGVGRGEMGKG